MAAYSETLRRLRREAGFSSGRSFYRGRGGRAFFGCTYKAYLNIEAGRSIPQPSLSFKIASALRVEEDERRAREYVSSYLRSALGREELADFLARSIGRPDAAGPQSLLQKATETSFSTRAKPLSQEQAELLYRDAPAYWCFTLLSNDQGRWEATELARRLGYPPARARQALAVLIRSGLLAQDRSGRFYCQHAGKVFLFPRDKFFLPKTLSRLKAHWDAMAQSRGKVLFERSALIRASEAALREYFPYLGQNVYNSHLYGTDRTGADTGVYVAEARVRRLLPF